MRTLFLIIVLANIGFFAWSNFLSSAEGNADPLPLTRQIQPQKLRIVAPSEAAKGAPPAKPAAALASSASCMEWGAFAPADAPRAEKALEPLALGERVAQRRTEETAGWWVYIAPQANRPGALKKAAELKGLGIEDYFVVGDEGPFRWAVSLGVFRTEEAAQARLATLRDQGVKSALVGPRDTVVSKVWLQVKGVDAALEARLKDVARTLEGSELRSCPQESQKS